VGILMSCGGGGGGTSLTDGQKLLRAIDGSWAVNSTSSNTEGVEGTPDLSGVSVTVTPNTEETGASYSFSGTSITQYFTGGSFSVSDAGVITSPALDAASGSSLTVSTVTISENGTTLTIAASVSASTAKGAGVGNWVLVFDLN
ncbi:MAG: hypothetical protein ACO2ZZ_13855, partial [Cyclobacteriaceae bacterium]